MIIFLLFISLLCSVFFIYFNKRKIGLIITIINCFLVLIIGSGLIAHFILANLQSSFKNDAPLNFGKNNAIILLGAGTTKIDNQSLVKPTFFAYSRIMTTAALYFSCKKTQATCSIIISGGDPSRTTQTEATVYTKALTDIAIPQSAIILEPNSQNTFQNAQFTKQIILKYKFDQLFLVTSGLHMKRSLLYFSYFDLYPISVTADCLKPYISVIPLGFNITITDLGLHELAGIWRFYLYNFFGLNNKSKV